MRNLFLTFNRYAIVALLAMAADWLVYTGLNFLGVYYIYSQMVSRIMGGVVSFFLNKYWGFKSRESNTLAVQGFRFLLLYIASYVLSISLLRFFVEYVGLSKYISKLLGDGACFVFNFIVMKLYVYAPNKAPQVEK